MADETHALFNRAIDARYLQLGLSWTAVVQDVLHHAFCPFHLFLNVFGQPTLLLRFGRLFEEKRVVQVDRGERVVQFVRHFRGKLTDRCQPLGAHDVVVQGAQLLHLRLQLLVESGILNRQRRPLEKCSERLVMEGVELGLPACYGH